MRPAALFTASVALALASLAGLGGLAGCPGGGGGLGDSCSGTGDCNGELQCLDSLCVRRCEHAPECGDGFACTAAGLCVAATGQTGDACTSEDQCAASLACQLDGSDVGSDHFLLATCGAAVGARPAEATCEVDGDCRNGTCALGRCVDLCDDNRACLAGDECTEIPRVGVGGGALFHACLPHDRVITWSIPVDGPSSTIDLPVPSTAREIELVMSTDDVQQKVGALTVHDPSGAQLLSLLASDPTMPDRVRHAPDFGQSVLLMPSVPDTAGSPTTPAVPSLPTGVYAVAVASLRPPFFVGGVAIIGSATPRVTAVAKLGTGARLDLHFYFLDFTDHPCSAAFSGDTLSASTASVDGFFQIDFLQELFSVLNRGGLSPGQITYEDLSNHHDLDGLDVANASALLALGAHATGINVFFVRTLSPVGLQTFGPNPGPAGIGGTRQSGIVIGLDTLCYRSWPEVARLTARELAHYMGLYDNITIDGVEDPIGDSGSDSDNLMFYAEFGSTPDGHGTALSVGQHDILVRSGVLQ